MYQLGMIAKTGEANFWLTLGTSSVTARGQSEAHEPRVAKKFNESRRWRMLKRVILGCVDVEWEFTLQSCLHVEDLSKR